MGMLIPPPMVRRAEPMANQFAPRRVTVARAPSGFGFSLSSQFPCKVVALDAAGPAVHSGRDVLWGCAVASSRPGIQVNDQILEINGVSVRQSVIVCECL